jgi:hypothetical protein
VYTGPKYYDQSGINMQMSYWAWDIHSSWTIHPSGQSCSQRCPSKQPTYQLIYNNIWSKWLQNHFQKRKSEAKRNTWIK